MISPSGEPALTLRMARLDGDDPDAYARHIVDHMAESGRGGLPHFAISRIWSRDDVRAGFVVRLSKPLDEPLWGRTWLLFAPGASADRPRVVGHLELRGGRVPAEMHRATLGMGILRAHTGRGHGRRLVEAAVRWARDDAGLSWIDLGVFASNAPARKLYSRMGFLEIGRREDAFHLDAGPYVDDVQMALRLR
jgi:RimJ/RimL family protein N-acetyltransferase